MHVWRLRAFYTCLLALAGLTAAAQPVINGTVDSGEYTYASGDWSMAWDDTYLYVAKINAASSTAISVQLDTDPLPSTPTGGTAANGNVAGPSEVCCGGTGFGVTLPFRGDARLLLGGGASSLMIRDGAGDWMEGDGGDWTGWAGTNAIELRIRWDGIPGLSGRPAAFNWLGYQLSAAGLTTSLSNATPPAIPAAATTLHYFWSVANMTAAESTNPFSVRHLNFRVTDTADSGTNTLRNAITLSSADADSAKRFITFGLAGGTVQMLSALPDITRTVTIDGTTDTAMPVLDGVAGMTGLHLVDVRNAIVRGLSLQDFQSAIRIDDGSANTVAANQIGTSIANLIGVNIDGCQACVVGGPSDADRNLINGNDTAINVTNATGTVIQNNYLGVDASGAIAAGNNTGIAFGDAPGIVIGGESGEGNVISGNTGPAIAGDTFSTGVTILGNRIGVAATTDAALGNGGAGITGVKYATIGSLTAPNVIANNTGGAIGVGPGNVIRGNSIFDNAVDVTGGQPAPTVIRAVADGDSLLIRFSTTSSNVLATTQSLQLDLYANVSGPKVHLAASPCFSGNSMTTNWTLSGEYDPGDEFLLMATAYQDASCSNPGDGTSEPSDVVTAVARNTTITTVQISDDTPWSGQDVTLTATIADGYSATGTVAFFDNGSPITGCDARPVENDRAQCSTTFSTDGSHLITATYSGDDFNDGSTSAAVPVTVSTHVFTGTGNFTDSARWSNNTLPGAGENFRIEGTCTFDNSGVTHRYGAMTVAAGGTLQWTANHSTPLRVTSAAGNGAITMTGGGTLDISGHFNAASLLFIRGLGTLQFSGPTQVVPALSYYNLSITGASSVSSGQITVFNALMVGPGSTFNLIDLVTVHSSIANAGTLQFAQLSIPSGATVTAFNSFSATSINVDGTFVPVADAVITGALTGTGTAYVTGIATSNSFASQYNGAKTLTNLTVHFEGSAAQSIDTLDYFNLTINNGAGASIAPNTTARVSGTLHLQAGKVTVSPSGVGELEVTNTSPSAVVRTDGWIEGEGFSRWIATGTGSYLFPVGLATGAAPVTVTYHGVTAPGEVQFSAHTAASFGVRGAGSGINSNRDANVYWRSTHTLTHSSYDVQATFFFLPDAGAVPLQFVLRARHGNAWIDTAATPAEQSISATDIPPHGDLWFSAGNQLASAGLSQITAADTSLDTSESTAITVEVRDSGNFAMNYGGDTVTLATTVGTLSAITDNLDGTYTATLSSTSAGTATITGTVNGANILDNASVVFTAAKGDTTTSVVSSQNPSTSGQSVTFTATVSSATSGTISGTVTFKDGSTTIGSGTISGGVATFTTSSLSTGSHSVTAEYGGNVNFNGSTSSTLTQTVNPASFGPPPFIAATATGTSSVTVSWSTVSGAASYRVYRATSVSGVFAPIGEVAATVFNDGGRSANTTYLYKVSAVASGSESTLSATDAATTLVFTDASLTGVIAKAVHITELQTAVNAMRAAGNLSAFTFSAVTTGATIRLSHLIELRTHLNAARAAIGLPAISYTDPSPVAGSTTIKAAHITELRAGTQ